MELNFFYAKHKHKMWKMHLKAFLLGLENFDEKRITSSKNCELGKWIQNHAKQAFNGYPELDQLINTHEKVHEIVKEIPKLKKDNKIEEAYQKFEQLEKESGSLIQILDKIEEKEKSEQGGTGKAETKGDEKQKSSGKKKAKQN